METGIAVELSQSYIEKFNIRIVKIYPKHSDSKQKIRTLFDIYRHIRRFELNLVINLRVDNILIDGLDSKVVEEHKKYDDDSE